MATANPDQRALLQQIARRAMLERGLLPDFSPDVLAELGRMDAAAPAARAVARDLRDLPWASIDNDDSRDLDQLTVAEAAAGGEVKVLVAVADVDCLVTQGSAIDGHAQHNTASVYTAAQVFPMLPEALSTGLTSLNPGEDRLSIVVELVVAADGSSEDGDVYRARVRNHAKLAYNGVAGWLEGDESVPAAIGAVEGLAENLRLQDEAAQRAKAYRHAHGALSLQTVEARPVFDGDVLRDLRPEGRNRAKDLIESFMIGANGVIVRYLAAKGFPSVRRVVRSPERWDRIVALAAEHGVALPAEPDAMALEGFLTSARAADPVRFPDLSLSVIKLLGSGEYVADAPGEGTPGHFGLAVQDYGHSTAPNRRYSDLVTQRLLKAAVEGRAVPYALAELEELAAHCTHGENAINKVERQVAKSAAALLFESRLGEHFDAIVTGASEKGTWVRLLTVPVEGKLTRGTGDLDVGDRVGVRLVRVDVELGHIDFERAG